MSRPHPCGGIPVANGSGSVRPGAKVLYLGAASGTSVSHVSDIVGPTGTVFAVEFSHRSGRDLISMATHRTNVIPIIEDARHPLRYRMLVSMVDVIFVRHFSDTLPLLLPFTVLDRLHDMVMLTWQCARLM